MEFSTKTSSSLGSKPFGFKEKSTTLEGAQKEEFKNPPEKLKSSGAREKFLPGS